MDGPVSPFIVLLLLFGHAGSDLASPHVAAGWSNEKITEWLSTHASIKERYKLIAFISRYATTISPLHFNVVK